MERQEILSKISEILKSLEYVSNISEDTKIQDLDSYSELDDYDFITIEIELERKFELQDTSCDSIIEKSETIKEVIDKLSDLINK